MSREVGDTYKRLETDYLTWFIFILQKNKQNKSHGTRSIPMWGRRDGETGFEKALNERDMICGGAPSVSGRHVICMSFLYIISYRGFLLLGLALEQIEDDKAWLGSTTGYTSNRIPAQTHSINPGEWWWLHHNILSVLYIPAIIVLGGGVFLVWECIDFCFAVFPLGTHFTPPWDSCVRLLKVCPVSPRSFDWSRPDGRGFQSAFELPNDALHSDPGRDTFSKKSNSCTLRNTLTAVWCKLQTHFMSIWFVF